MKTPSVGVGLPVQEEHFDTLRIGGGVAELQSMTEGRWQCGTRPLGRLPQGAGNERRGALV